MADFLKSAGGMALAVMMGKMRRDSDNAYIDQRRAANKLPALVREKAPIDKATDWLGEKFSSLTSSSPPEAPGVPGAAPSASGESVGFMERLKAGNIDAPGSEAYNRWGAGREQGIAMSDDIQAKRLAELPQAESPPAAFSPEGQQLVDDMSAESLKGAQESYAAQDEGLNSPDRSDSPFGMSNNEWAELPDANTVQARKMDLPLGI